MIKINLLGVAPAPSRIPAVGGPPTSFVTQGVVFLGALIICFGIVGVLYKVWNSEHTKLTGQMATERRRQADLEVVKTQNTQYQQHLQDLETRFNTMHMLQASRTGPVELMNSLGIVVNQVNDVYLYTMAPTGERLLFKGESATVDSMANFLAFMKKSGAFSDVQLDQFYEDDQHERLNYKFTMSCQFISPTTGTTPAAAVGAAPAGPSAGPPNVPAQTPPAPKRAL